MNEIVWRRIFKAASLKRIGNAIQVFAALGLSRLTGKSITWGQPMVLTVEPTVRCNLRCPQCVTGMGKTSRGQADLELALFQSLLDEVGDAVWYLLLFNQGEPFLHPQLLEFIRRAKQKRICVTISTNGHFFADRGFVSELTATEIDCIIISLDGADALTYEKYRQGGDFQRVVQGIQNLVDIKKQMKMRTPVVMIQCLVMRQNEYQVRQMKHLRRKLGVDRLLLKTMQVENPAQAAELLPLHHRWRRYNFANVEMQAKTTSRRGCSRLWYSAVVLSDGRVVPCCFDKNGIFSFGSVAIKNKLTQIWKSDDYQQFRARFLESRNGYAICSNCTQGRKIYF
ncbi:MAG: radical SAM protein [candidate division KSB1 bacterium]|nr:radical SAM protein [candidate division KSB1 bacterium]MDZ7318159.1 radical SAM protein [candidate division KSB1 bacterium]MDZ7342388.1 radical SAM protein [candidate division KSB1 bacterium]